MFSMVMEQEKFEHTYEVITNHKSKQDRQYNGKKGEKDKRTNIDLQKNTQKTKDPATRTPLNTSVSSDAPEG